MRCQKIMSSPVQLALAGEVISTAARRMRDANVGFLPVCDPEGRVIGVITDRDITVRACAEDALGVPVEEVMTPDVVTCHPDDELEAVEALMREHGTSRILVTDVRGRPVGVVSIVDLAQVDEAGAGQTLRQVGERELREREPDRVADASGWGTHLLGLRRRMVEELVQRGLSDRAVLRAMLAVPREVFMPSELALHAYDDREIRFGGDRTLPTPYSVALMAAALRPTAGDRLLEVGAGNGYATAIFASLAGNVTSTPADPAIGDELAHHMRALGVGNVKVLREPPARASYEAIVVHGGAASMSEPLLDKLAVGGRMVLAIETPGAQTRIVRITRTGDNTFRRDIIGAPPPAQPRAESSVRTRPSEDS